MNDEQKAFIDELLGAQSAAGLRPDGVAARSAENVSHGAPDKEIRVRQFMQRVFGDKDNRKREEIRPIVQDLIDGNYESYNRWISQPRNKGQAKRDTYARRFVYEVQSLVRGLYEFTDDPDDPKCFMVGESKVKSLDKDSDKEDEKDRIANAIYHRVYGGITEWNDNSSMRNTIRRILDGDFSSYNAWVSDPPTHRDIMDGGYHKKLVDIVREIVKGKYEFDEDTFKVGPKKESKAKQLFRKLRKIAKREDKPDDEKTPLIKSKIEDNVDAVMKDSSDEVSELHISDLDVSNDDNQDEANHTVDEHIKKQEDDEELKRTLIEEYNKSKAEYDKLMDELEEMSKKKDMYDPELERMNQLRKRVNRMEEEPFVTDEKKDKKTQELFFNHHMNLFQHMFYRKMALALSRRHDRFVRDESNVHEFKTADGKTITRSKPDDKFRNLIHQEIQWLIDRAKQFARSDKQFLQKKREIIDMVNEKYFGENNEYGLRVKDVKNKNSSIKAFRVDYADIDKQKTRVEKGYMNQNAPNKDVFFTYRMDDIYSIIEDYYRIKLSVPIKSSIESIVKSNIDEYSKKAMETGNVTTATIAHGRDVIDLIEQYINSRRNIHIKVPFKFKLESRSSLNELIKKDIVRYRNDNGQKSKNVLSFIESFKC